MKLDCRCHIPMLALVFALVFLEKGFAQSPNLISCKITAKNKILITNKTKSWLRVITDSSASKFLPPEDQLYVTTPYKLNKKNTAGYTVTVTYDSLTFTTDTSSMYFKARQARNDIMNFGYDAHSLVYSCREPDVLLRQMKMARLTAVSWNIPSEKLGIWLKNIKLTYHPDSTDAIKLKLLHAAVDVSRIEMEKKLVADVDERLAVLRSLYRDGAGYSRTYSLTEILEEEPEKNKSPFF